MILYRQLRRRDVKSAVRDIQQRLGLPDHAIKYDVTYRDSVLMDIAVKDAKHWHGNTIRECFEELCHQHGWQPPYVEYFGPDIPFRDKVSHYQIELRRLQVVTRSQALLPD
jgi:hypothetical protein